MTQEQLDRWYDEKYFDQYPKHVRRIRQIVKNLEFDVSDLVCEFGCGLGHIQMAIAGKIQQGVGIDVSEYAITRARESVDKASLSNLEFNTYDIIQLGEAEDYQSRFDKVLMMDISEHLYDDTLLKFLHSAKRILKPSGSLILHTPNANYYLERMKARNFILKQFESHIAVRNFQQHVPLLQAAGFSEIEVKYLPHYNRVLGTLDRVLSQIPLIKTLFQARILITAKLP